METIIDAVFNKIIIYYKIWTEQYFQLIVVEDRLRTEIYITALSSNKNTRKKRRGAEAGIQDFRRTYYNTDLPILTL